MQPSHVVFFYRWICCIALKKVTWPREFLVSFKFNLQFVIFEISPFTFQNEFHSFLHTGHDLICALDWIVYHYLKWHAYLNLKLNELDFSLTCDLSSKQRNSTIQFSKIVKVQSQKVKIQFSKYLVTFF